MRMWSSRLLIRSLVVWSRGVINWGIQFIARGINGVLLLISVYKFGLAIKEVFRIIRILSLGTSVKMFVSLSHHTFYIQNTGTHLPSGVTVLPLSSSPPPHRQSRLFLTCTGMRLLKINSKDCVFLMNHWESFCPNVHTYVLLTFSCIFHFQRLYEAVSQLFFSCGL